MASREKDEDTNAIGKELWAALKRDPLDKEQIKLLLEFGAPANFREPDSRKFDLTPLHLAAEKGNLRAVKKLVNNPYSPADRNKRNRDDETATQVAERKQRKSVLHYLLNDYANDGDVRSDGDANVNVSTSAGSSVTVSPTGGTVNIIVGDHGTINLNDGN
ncbi:uncharacterized protein LOC110067359 isoform X2 [Orbicella faveolata]|uniref:uncharacterized protein LOC110067359 isoform X2 n=1 Tax=Orbicella faveolata TaxID=48498 RepID=UPI0009E46F20|nr:uncharacterized protein LOC110067359 isoform X2 [Orbicella faveolata]